MIRVHIRNGIKWLTYLYNLRISATRWLRFRSSIDQCRPTLTKAMIAALQAEITRVQLNQHASSFETESKSSQGPQTQVRFL